MTNTNLTEGMKISEEELIALGCRFIGIFGTNNKVFERESQLIYWNFETQTIWRILSKSKESKE
jgi:hypothetical protein